MKKRQPENSARFAAAAPEGRLAGAGPAPGKVQPMRVVDLDREAIKRGLADGSMLVIDVREPHEYAGGHIPGAVTHPLSTFDPAAIAALIAADPRQPVFACAAGVRSLHALHAVQNAGLAIEAHYRGGFKDWYLAGEAIAWP